MLDKIENEYHSSDETLVMINLSKTMVDGVILSMLASFYLVGILWFNPRLFLQDYPDEIQERVPPKTDQEKRNSLVVGIPFLLLLFAVPFISTLTLQRQHGSEIPFHYLSLNAFGVGFIFNLIDLLVLDWLIFCLITPRFLVIPGTEEMKAYKDYGYHFRGFLIGMVISIAAGLVIGGIVMFF